MENSIKSVQSIPKEKTCEFQRDETAVSLFVVDPDNNLQLSDQVPAFLRSLTGIDVYRLLLGVYAAGANSMFDRKNTAFRTEYLEVRIPSVVKHFNNIL